MSASEVGVRRALSDGWASFLKNPGLMIGGSLLFFAISMVGSSIPVVGSLYAILVAFPLQGGLTVFYLNLVRGTNPQIGDIFSGFSSYGKWMGVGWLLVAIEIPVLLVTAIPILAALGIDNGVLQPQIRALSDGPRLDAVRTTQYLVYGIGGVLTLIVVLVVCVKVLVRLAFVFYTAADGQDTMGALRESWRITEGVSLRLFGVTIVLGLVAMAGLIACGIGVLFTSWITTLAFVNIYLLLRPQPAVSMEPPPPEPVGE